MARSRTLTCLVAILALQGLAIQAEASPADKPGDVVARYVDNETFLVGRLDVRQLPLSDLQTRIVDFFEKTTNDPSMRRNIEPAAKQVLQLRRAHSVR